MLSLLTRGICQLSGGGVSEIISAKLLSGCNSSTLIRRVSSGFQRRAWQLRSDSDIPAGPSFTNPAMASTARSFLTNEPKKATNKHASAAELGLYWGAAAVGMLGLSYATVPLYKMFCAATGYGGAVNKGAQTVEDKMKKRKEKPDLKVEEAAAQREVVVWFNGDVADNMPWEFKPTQQCVKVRPGQSTLVFFTAKNKSDKAITGYSVYNVTPDKAAIYFNKIQCFCFEEQRLRANEEVDMPVFFYLDPELASDWNCRNVDDITLSYTFHMVDDEDLEEQVDDDAPTLIKLHGPGGATLNPSHALGSSQASIRTTTSQPLQVQQSSQVSG